MATSQPLAKLLPRLLETQKLANNELDITGDSHSINIANPKYMRMHIDNTLVETLNQVFTTCSSEGECNKVWDTYWKKEQGRIKSNKVYHGGTSPKTTYTNDDTKNTQISDSQSALNVFQSLDFIAGFHPDQATEAAVDLALLLKVPFAIVPCCVFKSEFPNRMLDGKQVKTHSELVEYLCLKHENIRKTTLPFIETNTAKNVVLYMLKEDFATTTR